MISSARAATSEEWDSLVDSVKSTTYFQTREWFEIWSEYAGFRNETKLITFGSGKRVLLPLTSICLLKGLVKIFFSAPKGMGGFVSPDELDPGEKAALFKFFQKIGLLYFVANPYDGLSNEYPKFNSSDITHVLDLREGFEEIFKRWSEGHRRAAARGRNKGVTVDLARTEEDWRSYYELYRCSVSRWGKNATNNYDSRLFDIIKEKNSDRIKLWVARYNGRIISGAICFYHNNHVAAWNGATDSSFMKLDAPHIVLHYSIKDAVENGYALYDLMPSGGHRGVTKFKAGFAAPEKKVNVYMSPSLKLASAARSHVRNSSIYKCIMKDSGF